MKETKTVQVYPDDNLVNATIEEYGSFGWEVINNQRCQEFTGQTHGVDGSTTNNYSTFNKITFTREKSSAWYEEVSALESEYNSTISTISSYKNRKPILRTVTPDGIVGTALGFLLYCMWIIPGIIYTVKRSSKRKQYQKQYEKESAEYNAEYPEKIKELERKRSELRTRAEKLVLGKL